MRNVKECQAEIFRRSEIRIQKRKRRNKRILAFCMPLCICFVLWSVLILPAMLPASSGESFDAEGRDEIGEGTSSLVSATISDFGKKKTQTDAHKVAMLYSAVMEPFSEESAAEDQATESKKENNAENPEAEGTLDQTNQDVARQEIMFRFSTGEEYCFVYGENQLCDVKNQKKAALSAEEWNKISELFE